MLTQILNYLSMNVILILLTKQSYLIKKQKVLWYVFTNEEENLITEVTFNIIDDKKQA